MPILSDFRELKPQIDFYNNPLYEMTASLHVLADPGHHTNCCEWAGRISARLSDGLKKEIRFFSRHYAQWILIADIMTERPGRDIKIGADGDIRPALERIRNMKEPDFSYLFLGLSIIDFDKNDLTKWLEDPDRITAQDLQQEIQVLTLENIRYYLKNRELVKDRLVKVLEAYWNEAFRKEWGAIGQYIAKVIGQEKIILNRSNPLEYILRLHKDVVLQDNRIVFKKTPEYGIRINDIQNVRIFPSVFSDPHLMANVIGNNLIICINLNFHSVMLHEDIPRDLFDLLNAMGDLSRLKVIKILWNGDSTTKELSEILKLTPGSVSQHLKILKKANLVQTKKVKKCVYYQLIKDPFYDMNQKIIEYFEY